MGLPAQSVLLDLYLKDDLSFSEIAAKYGVKTKTVYTTMKRRQERAGASWPLKSLRPNRYARSGAKVKKRLDTITAEMVKHEINHAVETLPCMKKDIAELCDVSAYTIGRVANGHYVRIKRSTAEGIMGAIETLEKRKKVRANALNGLAAARARRA